MSIPRSTPLHQRHDEQPFLPQQSSISRQQTFLGRNYGAIPEKERDIDLGVGTTAAILGPIAWIAFKIHIVLHEVIGHGLFGGALLYNYTWKTIPTFKLGYMEGWARVHSGEPNALGRWIGDSALRAWVSFSGTVPGLAFSCFSLVRARRIYQEKPGQALALTTIGLFEHALNCMYVFGAIGKIKATGAYATSHDWVNWAHRMSQVTQSPPLRIAKITAAFLLFLPFFAVGIDACIDPGFPKEDSK